MYHILNEFAHSITHWISLICIVCLLYFWHDIVQHDMAWHIWSWPKYCHSLTILTNSNHHMAKFGLCNDRCWVQALLTHAIYFLYSHIERWNRLQHLTDFRLLETMPCIIIYINLLTLNKSVVHTGISATLSFYKFFIYIYLHLE